MSDPGGTTPGELGGMVAGVAALLGMIGAGLKWLGGWANKREENRATRNARWEADLDARERTIEEKLSASLSHCEGRCAAVEEKFDKVRIALLLILPELQRVAPPSPVLKQVRDLLRDIFPVPFGLPADIGAEISALDALGDRPAPMHLYKDEI
jgi:hypothetical protein